MRPVYFPKRNRVLTEIVKPFLQSIILDTNPWKLLATGTTTNYWNWSRNFIGEFYKNWEKHDEYTNKKGKNWKKKAPDFVQALKNISKDQFDTVKFLGTNTRGTKEVWQRLYNWIKQNFQSSDEFDLDSPILHSCSLFSGAGGFDIGIEATGRIKTTFASDFCPITKETFLTNFYDADFVLGDIRELLRQEVFEDLAGKFDLVTAGFPCQPYSRMGKEEGPESEVDRFPETVEAILQLKPTAFILENVEDLKIRWLPLLEEKINELDSGGYKTDFEVLSASEWGAATSRRRLFIVGSRKGYIEWPLVQTGDPLRPEAPLIRNLTVRDAIPERFGTPNTSIVEYKCPIYWKQVYPSPYTSYLSKGRTVARIINENVPCPTITTTPLVHYFDTEGHMTDFWSNLFALKEKKKEEGGRILLDECGNDYDYWLEDPITGRSKGWTDVREGPVPGASRLTPEEAASIQGFPPHFKFAYGSEETMMDDLFRQIGNSVPPNLAYVLAKSLLIQKLL